MSKKEGIVLAGILITITVVGYLLWGWIAVPPEVSSPAVSAMSVWGFGIIALPASFLIGIVVLRGRPGPKWLFLHESWQGAQWKINLYFL